MKKFLALILALAMIFALCGCGKSENVKQTEAMIEAIGEVTLDNASAVADARDAYDQLSDKEQKQVSNLSVLEDAEAQYSALLADQYDQAMALAESGKYGDAAEMFAKIADYKDSRAQSEKCEEASNFISSNTYAMIVYASKDFPKNWSNTYQFADHAVVILCDFDTSELPGSVNTTKAWEAWDKLLTSFVGVSASTKGFVERGGFPNIDSIVRVRCTADDTILYECKNGEVIFDHTH